MVRVAVFGLGYVGIVSAACLAECGHDVIGVDVSAEKVRLVNDGKTTVLEERIGELVAAGVTAGRLRATTDAREAVRGTDLAFICVGTPSSPSGALSTSYLERVAADIGAVLPSDRPYTVVVRSTMLPGTCQGTVVPQIEKASGMTAGVDFAVCVQPEFLREGSSVRDFYDPPKTLIGSDDAEAASLVASLYEGFSGPVFHVPVKVAEMAKYVDNAFHALKVGFANEIGAICKAADVDSHTVMDIFKSDTKLNISTAYLTPGLAFGGSCLPKDLRAIVHFARHSDVAVPILEHVIESNEQQLQRAYDLVAGSGRRCVGIFGLAFKAGTDDLRESPMVTLAERLLGRGFDVLIHDPNVTSSHLLGANRDYVESHLPHLSRLLRTSVDDVVEHAEVCVIGVNDAEVLDAVRRAGDRVVVDLVRSMGDPPPAGHDGPT